MHNVDNAVQKLNFTIDINELSEYYNTLQLNFKHLHWTWENNYIHLNDDAIHSCVNKCETLMHGWVLQSDMADRSMLPSMLRSKHPRVPWYNTELIFGLAKRLTEAIPFAYRWSLFVLPPGGKVVKHTDQGEYAIHIPLHWDDNSIFVFGDAPETTEITFPPTGNAYLVDAEIPHATENSSHSDRVGLIFRIKREYLPDLLNIKGII